MTCFLLDPARVRTFARAERRLAKTDPLSGAVIARCLAALQAELTPHVHDPQGIRLTEHVRLRDLAAAQAVQFGRQLESIADPIMRRLIVAQVARLKAVGLRIEKAIAAVVAASPDLAARDALFRSAPGVDPVVAACPLARMPAPGRIASRQVTALANLATLDRQSGKTSRPGRMLWRKAGGQTLTLSGSPDHCTLRKRTARHDSRSATRRWQAVQTRNRRNHAQALNAMAKNNTKYHSA